MSIYMNKDGNVECVVKVNGFECQYMCEDGGSDEKKKNECFNKYMY